MYNVVIIGSGCSGLTAAIYAARASLKPLVIDGHEPGGQLSLTTHVENFPGFPDGIMGPELIENMRKQATKFGTEFKAGTITEVDLSRRPFKITAGKDVYEAKTLIVAAGASARLIGLPNERALIGHGVSTCATCDGYFFRNRPIAVVGGGDSAMEEANFLSRYANKVYLIHRRAEFRASKIMIDRAKANEKIEFVVPAVVDQIIEKDGSVEGVQREESGHGRDARDRDSRNVCGDRARSEQQDFQDEAGHGRERIFGCDARQPDEGARACLSRATCRIIVTGRRLRRLGRAAWRRWTRKSSWKSTRIKQASWPRDAVIGDNRSIPCSDRYS